jgi:hypothetical protein
MRLLAKINPEKKLGVEFDSAVSGYQLSIRVSLFSVASPEGS